MDRRAHAKEAADRTGQWAKVLAKCLITRASRGKKQWQIVSFEGSHGGESTGIVDFIAIRKDHRSEESPLKKGDLLEIVLVLVKGGTAKPVTPQDRERLASVAQRYGAKAVLADWTRGAMPRLFKLERDEWCCDTPEKIFDS